MYYPLCLVCDLTKMLYGVVTTLFLLLIYAIYMCWMSYTQPDSLKYDMIMNKICAG